MPAMVLKPIISMARMLGEPVCNAADFGAVVVIVSAVLPFPVTEVGLKLQLLSLGNPLQEPALKVTVPL
jgi:serine protease inhibitor ecotin